MVSLAKINALCRPYYDKAKRGLPLEEAAAPFFNGKTSLFWYRGYFHEPKATEAEVDETLKLYGVKRIVVGHSIVPGNVGFYYGGKVLGFDVNQHEGDHQAALVEKKQWLAVDDKGNRKNLKEN